MQLFKPRYQVDAILDSIKQSLESGWTGEGPKCKAFQDQLVQYFKTPHSNIKYLNSATSALHLALKALNLPSSSRIATTPITFVSTNSVILHENHIPIFLDVSPIDLSLDADLVLKAAHNKQIDAVMWVHYAGSVRYRFLDTVEQLKALGIPVIEDCAHAMGATYPGTTMKVGSHKDTISCFSFQAVKNLPTADSGAIVVPNKEQFERISKLAWLGIDKSTHQRTGDKAGEELYKWRYSVEENGYKYNSNDIMASIAIEQLKVLDSHNEYRRNLYEQYFLSLFENENKVSVFQHSEGSSHHLIEIAVENRDEVMNELRLNGYAPGVHYIPNYYFPAFQKYKPNGNTPVTENVAEKLLTLPTHLDVTPLDVQKITEIVLEHAKPFKNI